MQNRNVPYQRFERVSELIKRELGKLILQEINFEGAIVTVIDAEVSKKLDYAKIFVSILPKEREKKGLLMLSKNRFDLQKKLLRRINIRPMPRIEFKLTSGPEKAANISKILTDLDIK